MAFWKRKNKERFITLGLNEPSTNESAERAEAADKPGLPLEPPAGQSQVSVAQETAALLPPTLEPAATGAAPTPFEVSNEATVRREHNSGLNPPIKLATPAATLPPTSDRSTAESSQPRAVSPAPPRPVPTRSPFATSVLGLDRSIEDLQAEEAALEQALAARFRRAVAATRESLSERIDTVFQGRKQIDATLLDELEEALIAADIGVPTTMEILDTVRRGIARKQINDIEALKEAIKNQLLQILREAEQNGIASETKVAAGVVPYVLMIVGVNGVGKTTTIGKLAQRIKAEGNDVLICAADTFRAAASDQLAIWAERTGVPLIQQKQGTDPAAVLFDSLRAARARGSDVLIVDTAGRLHNKSNLMSELEKMKRVAGREVEGAPHETLLVIDAVTGQNGLEQARQFLKVAGVTGIVLTKLDGTAKGGIAVAIAKELRLPIRYVGIGEKVDDLVVFDPEQYVNSLFN
ncbi:MAG: signal recognition particle-docking protein FtsY [Pyrinomonadaceae bacterium]|nr:signal recognition particle-docking protein FtsY [Pyrinomonadaceae bacterium]